MSDPFVLEIGEIDDIDGALIYVGVDYDSVTIGGRVSMHRLSLDQAEEFAKMFITACWAAGENHAKMAVREPNPETEAALDALRMKLAGNG